MQPDAVKVLIYAVRDGHLLVFDEPDFPAIELQVPGGTVEVGEDLALAAAREFEEETGLIATALRPLGVSDYRFEKNGRCHHHRRHYFRCEVPEAAPAEWHHVETTPFGGGEPICFHFSWIPIAEARKHLGYDMEALLDRL
ncbi:MULTISPECIES: NUDIX domain-containing protein [unclassified Rhizobium]|jgi:8-oxo-dGTP pyrophosphatase MutT (NUDIX family)|uniref:NUDIX hydrolase n=1 Tax=unclassified Rhizobium TaxID=2613769 RepID=UPI0006465366|nr:MULTISPECIES: NUDIX domain-containing protein [unclassified Rhizobium]MBN8952761.1 NUDIX domain-containing protein [Rhizobium tropici]OJY71428.1 MAG: DNA mismatch repair protein MutT [Rhizobium sp. 60-20]RKD55254.1 NUDIX domain-containing protein [Rhizobium sp. WW_1]